MTTLGATMCPTGCGRKQPPGKMMCLTCWREVPTHLQNEVYRTWRTYSKARKARLGTATFKATRDAYYAARDAALASIA